MSERNAIPGLGARIKELREELGLSQKALALAAGTATTTVSKLERDERSVSLELGGRIAAALQTHAGVLIPPGQPGAAPVEQEPRPKKNPQK